METSSQNQYVVHTVHRTPHALLPDNTLYLRASAEEVFDTCYRRAKYALIDGYAPKHHNSALSFGEAIHKALEIRYAEAGSGIVENTVFLKQFDAMSKLFEGIDVQDHRTLQYATDIIQEYNKVYYVEQFNVLNINAKPFVEVSFTVPLRTEGVQIMWCGKIDLAFTDGGLVFIQDHKTTSMMGSTFFDQYQMSGQMLGYVYAMRAILEHFNISTPCVGYEMNAIATRKPTKTGKGIEFQRQRYFVTDEMLEEWFFNTIQKADELIERIHTNNFPMCRTNCVTKYGKCPFYNVCALTPSSRQVFLDTQYDKKESPLLTYVEKENNHVEI